ncbi:MAG TPA: PucR family transcriptional regulator ligand-binding domain-containing protein [Beutenbergiaceae bacterium]|nr:PucR family transcriptional regulator ligand-binding domain-containing protein [Beutenbergiaceae bacterium]
MTDAYRVPVKEFLEMSGLLSSRILAGEGGTDRSVTTLSIIETPDLVENLQPHTFVMTGGFPLKHLNGSGEVTTEGLVAFISQLNDLQVAGIGIQFGSHLTGLPPKVLEVADELDFPVVELHQDIPLDRLFGHAIVEHSQMQADGLRRTEKLLLRLERLLLEGADVQRIGDQLAHTLGVGVLITSNDGRVMADAFTEAMREELHGWGLYDDTGRFRVEQVRLLHMTGDKAGSILAQPIFAAGSDLARLVAFAPGGIISEDVRYALQRAGNVVALLITQQNALGAVENKYRGDFLRDVLSGRSKNQEYCEEYASGLGWELAMPCIVVSAQIDPQDPREQPAPTHLRRAWQSRFHVAWTQVTARESKRFPVADFSDEVVAILALPEEDLTDPAGAVARLQRMVEGIVHRVSGDRGGGRRPFSVGTSRLVTSFEQLPDAYQQARRATEVGRRFTGGSSTSHFDDLGIHRLIGLIPDRQEMTAFAQDILGELARDTPQAEELRTTLQALLDNNLNVAETSRELFMHYNTMRYRIAKLEKILGPFATDPNLRLNIAVALQVRRIQV